jgi:hypothetical protein
VLFVLPFVLYVCLLTHPSHIEYTPCASSPLVCYVCRSMSSETSVPMDTGANSGADATTPAPSHPKRPAPEPNQALTASLRIPKRSRANVMPVRGQGAVNCMLPEGNAPAPDRKGKTHEGKKALCAADEKGRPGLLVTHYNVCSTHYSKGSCSKHDCSYFHASLGSIVEGGEVRFKAAGANTRILGECDIVAMDMVQSLASRDVKFAAMTRYDPELANAQAIHRAATAKQAIASKAAELMREAKELEAEQRRAKCDEVLDADGLVALNFENAPHPFKDAMVRVEPGSIVNNNRTSSSLARSAKCIPEEVQELRDGLKLGAFDNYPTVIGRAMSHPLLNRRVKKQLNAVYDLQIYYSKLCPGVCCQDLPEVESVFLCPFCLCIVFCSAKCARGRGHPQGASCWPHPVWP